MEGSKVRGAQGIVNLHGEGRGIFLTNHFPSLLPPKAQLLELRTNNYQLSDELRKNGAGEPIEFY